MLHGDVTDVGRLAVDVCQVEVRWPAQCEALYKKVRNVLVSRSYSSEMEELRKKG